MTAPTDKPEDWRDLAAEFALGLLSGDDFRMARDLDRADPEFTAEVAHWHGRMAPLLEESADVAPPAASWSRIAALISSDERKDPHLRQDNVVLLRQRVRRWQGLTAATSAVAAALAIVVTTGFLHQQPAFAPAPASKPAAAPMVAMIGDHAQPATVVASWDPAGQQLILAVPGKLQPLADHAHELWVIPVGGKPRSLGTMPAGKQMHMKLAEAIARLLDNGATIAISVEPPGGSPTGAPTGPVIASGALKPA